MPYHRTSIEPMENATGSIPIFITYLIKNRKAPYRQGAHDSSILAEGVGFEPTTEVSPGKRLAGARTRPLCDPSHDHYRVPSCFFQSLGLTLIGKLRNMWDNSSEGHGGGWTKIGDIRGGELMHN